MLLLLSAFLSQRGAAIDGGRPLEVNFGSPVLFGEVYVAPGPVRISTTEAGITLAEPSSMKPIGTVPATVSEAPFHAQAAARVLREGQAVRLQVHAGDRLYVAVGQVTARRRAQGDPPELQAKTPDAQLIAVPLAGETDRQLVERALRRFAKSVEHCGEKAAKQRWASDDKRFWNCACPLTKKWRLARIKETVRYHHTIGETKTGLTFHVAADGKVDNCTVWAGAPQP
jgi:hypothetical protein